jgi:hypothetical protein
MRTALHLIADRIAAMPVSHGTADYAHGYADAIRRVVRLLRWLADGTTETEEI